MTLARSPMSRTLPTERKVRTRRCAVKSCRAEFAPRSMTHKCCSVPCATDFAMSERVRKERSKRQEGLRKLKRRPDHIRETQTVFNAYIRKRDQLAGHPCISSGLPLDWSGNNVDAGHYRSRGSAPHLRFDERNVHAQSKRENRYASGNATDYRIGLINRYGLAYVEELEADQTGKEYTIPELIELKTYYRVKLKALTKEST